MQLRLITYTSYGPMIGCLACGASWLVRVPGETSATEAGTERSAGSASP